MISHLLGKVGTLNLIGKNLSNWNIFYRLAYLYYTNKLFIFMDSIVQLHDLKFEPIITQTQIKARVKQLAQEINAHYKDSKNLVLVGVLIGGAIFLADLAREITVPCVVDFLRVSSYEGTESTGTVVYNSKPKTSLKGCDVLIVEDLLDTGLSLTEIVKLIQQQQPKSIEICICLEKVGCKKHEIEAKYVGFKVGKEFLVGYGLDYNEIGRNLPHIYKLKPE